MLFTDCITCTAAPGSKCTECISTKKVETDGTVNNLHN